ncbi:MAG: pitrilysin family protein [Hyphomicrobiaceae bacterium]
MSVELTRLANGLTVMSSTMPHLETLALGIYAASGSRHEEPSEHGISHLLEHMAFKGTARRDARAIAEEIESAGGETNAATSVEATAYYARMLKGDAGLAMDVLGDILLNPLFAEPDLAVEKDVITQEIRATHDQPDDIVFDLFEATAFPDQPLGRPILGTEASVARIGSQALSAHLRAHYRPSHMVVAAAGAIDHDELVRHAEAQFGGLNPGSRPAPAAAAYRGGTGWHDGPFEQTTLVLGFPGPSYLERDFTTAQVLAAILGGGSSSRLFQEAREKLGLCYSIYAFVTGFSDAGLLGVHASTGPGEVDRLREVIVSELVALAERGPSEAETRRVKTQLRAGLLMALESSVARCEQIARQMLAYGRPLSMTEMVERIEAVGARDVRDLVRRLMTAARPTWAEVGPGASAGGHERVEALLDEAGLAVV